MFAQGWLFPQTNFLTFLASFLCSLFFASKFAHSPLPVSISALSELILFLHSWLLCSSFQVLNCVGLPPIGIFMPSVHFALIPAFLSCSSYVLITSMLLLSRFPCFRLVPLLLFGFSFSLLDSACQVHYPLLFIFFPFFTCLIQRANGSACIGTKN